MKTTLHPTPIAGLCSITIDHFEDERGFFIESWHKRDFAAAGLNVEFVQECHSRSVRRVIRGLHYQDMTEPLGKLVRCIAGAVFDVAVDLRASSPTFGKWHGIELTADNKKQFYVPPGFAHGFAALSEFAEVQYKQTGFYRPSAEGGIMWNDPQIGIDWPFRDPILSKRDQNQRSFAEYATAPAFP